MFTRHCAFFVENGFAIVFLTIYTRMIRQNKLAGRFLDAELDFARMMQKINDKITDTVNLDFDFM